MVLFKLDLHKNVFLVGEQKFQSEKSTWLDFGGRGVFQVAKRVFLSCYLFTFSACGEIYDFSFW